MKKINALIICAGLSMCIWGCSNTAATVADTAAETMETETTTETAAETVAETTAEETTEESTEETTVEETTAVEETEPVTYTAEQYVQMVKDSKMTADNNITYGDAFEKYFTSPEWKAYKSEKNGQEIIVVEFNGNGMYNESEAAARMQFSINIGAGRFFAEYFSIDGNGKSLDDLNLFVNSIYYSVIK